MPVASREPESIVGRLYAEVEKLSASEVDAITIPKLEALERSAYEIRRCPAHQLESSFYRFRAYFHPDDLPPNGSHLHDLLALKHAILAFQGLTNVLVAARRHLSVLPQILDDIREAWPAVWRYIEVIDSNYLRPNEAPIEGIGSLLVMQLIVPSVYQFLLEEELSDVWVASGVYPMFVRVWYRLGTDVTCDEWPLDITIAGFTGSLPATSAEISDQIIVPLGGESRVAKAAISHLRLAMHTMARVRSRSRPSQLDLDRSFETAVDVAGLAIHPKMAYALLAQNAVRQMTRAFVQLTALPVGHDIDFSIFLSYISINITITDSITWVIQALDAGILIALLRYDAWYSNSIQNDLSDSEPRHVEILVKILPRYLVFLSVVQSARRALKRAKKMGAEKGVARSSDIWAGWVAFESVVNKRVDIAGRFARQKNVCNRCGEVERRRRTFRPCSGCSDLYYCSSECQKRDWEVQHRQDCKDIQRNRLAGRIVNSSESDYAFAPTFIRQDFQELGVIDLCYREWGHNPPEQPSLYLDYASYPTEVETDEYIADFDGPSRRDVVCVHVVLPNEEETWFALRSDKDEDDRTDRLVGALASRGLVIARASPGVERDGYWFGENLDSDEGSDWTDTDNDDDGVSVDRWNLD